MEKTQETLDNVREYYGRILKSKGDLKTDACCSGDSLPLYLKKILKDLDEEIITKFYGCGSPIPLALEGCTVLDLGCGAGRDVYLVSALVGEKGRVIGVDMTDAQLEVARRHLPAQTRKFGYSRPNIEFKKGYIENLKALEIEDNSIDVVLSNCVINLSPDKKAVFREIFRVLKPGGELYFADIFAGCRVPGSIQADPVLLGECLGGAMYIEDFRRLLRELGCLDYRVVNRRKVALDNAGIAAKVGMVDFSSLTIRAFKLKGLEDICEDYGQAAVYLGTIPEAPHQFVLDDHHIFKTGKPMLVCGNTAYMLDQSRFGRFFQIMGDRSTHFGPFPCGPAGSRAAEGDGAGGCSC
ncbi:MAG: methyltransferase domain-containing protein [Deltaproteobacteria bacterium]|nr:MAG: methyltransferase domain-containing protein [Deltaproteobacteria bacterium]